MYSWMDFMWVLRFSLYIIMPANIFKYIFVEGQTNKQGLPPRRKPPCCQPRCHPLGWTRCPPPESKPAPQLLDGMEDEDSSEAATVGRQPLWGVGGRWLRFSDHTEGSQPEQTRCSNCSLDMLCYFFLSQRPAQIIT